MGGWISAVDGLLVRSGLLPPCGAGTAISSLVRSGENLLPVLAAAWETAAAAGGRSRRQRAARWRNRLRACQAAGAALTLGVPGSPQEAVAEWLGVRLAWWPEGVVAGRRVGLASSRLGRAVDTEKSWFAALRAVCDKVDPRHDVLLAASATAAARYVERGAELFGLKALRVELWQRQPVGLDKWLQRMIAATDRSGSPRLGRVFLSPPLTEKTPRLDETPLRDRALVALSNRLMVFRLRPGGNVHRLVAARLADPAWPVASVYVALGPRLVRTEMAAELMELGAVGWVVLEPEQPAEGPRVAPQAGTAPIVPLPPAEGWPFLIHATRRCHGPWPDQDEEEYLDDLILDRPAADHSPLAALKRIVSSRRLIATSQTIRGGTPVVSFTAVPLAELKRLRVFRPHRGRWDFEPYGICIRRDWLQQRGARPVYYGDDALWEQLPEAERPFFQQRWSRSRRGRTVDWAVEDEWRVVGDVALDSLPPEAGLLFVPTEAEARQLAACSRWPITVVGV